MPENKFELKSVVEADQYLTTAELAFDLGVKTITDRAYELVTNSCVGIFRPLKDFFIFHDEKWMKILY